MADMNPSYVVVANGMKFTLELFPRNLGKLCTKNQILVTASPVSPLDLEGYQLHENFITDIMEKLRDHPQIQGLDINLASAKRAPMQTLSISGPPLDKKRPGQKELDALHLTLMEEINRAVGEAHLVVPDSVIPLDEGVPITTRLEWNPKTRTTDAVMEFDHYQASRFGMHFTDTLNEYLGVRLAEKFPRHEVDQNMMTNKTQFIYRAQSARDDAQNALEHMNDITTELERNGFSASLKKHNLEIRWMDIPDSNKWQAMHESSNRTSPPSREMLEDALFETQKKSPDLLPETLTIEQLIEISQHLHHMLGSYYLHGHTVRGEVPMHAALEALKNLPEEAMQHLPESLHPKVQQGALLPPEVTDENLLPLARALAKNIDQQIQQKHDGIDGHGFV